MFIEVQGLVDGLPSVLEQHNKVQTMLLNSDQIQRISQYDVEGVPGWSVVNLRGKDVLHVQHELEDIAAVLAATVGLTQL